MISNDNIREALFKSYTPVVQNAFIYRKSQLFNDATAFQLIYEMNKMEKSTYKEIIREHEISVRNQGEFSSAGVSVQKDTVTGRLVSKVLTEENLPYLNGVKSTFDPKTGKIKFEGA